jgi:hypothetical protein
MMRERVLICAAVILFGVVLQADTLILRDGRRVQGQLLAVRDNVIEFEAQRGGPFGGRERVRVDRDEVLRIEFDDADRNRDRYQDDRDRYQDDRDRDRDRPGPGANGRPSGMREREVVVNAAQPWTDAGVTVRPGQTVYFQASGRVRWGPGRQDGPAGERNSPRNAGRPIPNRPAAALIGRIGDGDEYFFIGDDGGPIRVRGGGRLYLGINDDFLGDNSGSFRVTVFY